MKRVSGKVRVRARPVNHTYPTRPGVYFWSEWDATVVVYAKSRFKGLFVTPPGGIEIRVTPHIAGTFILAAETHDNGNT